MPINEDSRTGLVNRILEDEEAPAPESPSPKKPGPTGFEGLGQKKQDLSSYLDKYDLTEQQRKCISLRMEYGLEPREIGERLGITRQRVNQHLKRAEDHMKNFNANDRKRRGVNKGVSSYDAAENDY
jgi:RNA polymerase sigma factor (sigma-70 family)